MTVERNLPAKQAQGTGTASHYDEYFESRRPLAFGERLIRRWHGRMLAAAERVIPSLASKRILELGPGWGYLADHVRARGWQYAAVERNATNAEAMRARGFDVSCAAVPPFPAGAPADVVWMSHVIEHARDFVEAREIAGAAFRRLEPGGHVVVIAPDVLSWGAWFWEIDWSHGWPTSLGRIEQLLGDAGFRVVFARHTTAGVVSPVGSALLYGLFALVPFRLIDVLARALTGRRLALSFMSMFGWRHVYVIATKP